MSCTVFKTDNRVKCAHHLGLMLTSRQANHACLDAKAIFSVSYQLLSPNGQWIITKMGMDFTMVVATRKKQRFLTKLIQKIKENNINEQAQISVVISVGILVIPFSNSSSLSISRVIIASIYKHWLRTNYYNGDFDYNFAFLQNIFDFNFLMVLPAVISILVGILLFF